jgi:hypothetical protein
MDETQLLRLLNETRDEIARAETKASIALGAAGLVAGSVLGELFDRYPGLTALGKVALIGCVAAMLGGLVSLGLALIPKLFVNPGGHSMMAFFGHVTAAGSIAEFERLAVEPQDERSRLTNQIWTLSTLIMRKYQHIRRAFLCLGASVALGVVTMIVEAIAG